MTLSEWGSTSVELTWNQQPGVNSCMVSFERLRGSEEHLTNCSKFSHAGMIHVDDGTATGYNLTGLQEDSTYNITVTCINYETSELATGQNIVTTLQAGILYNVM